MTKQILIDSLEARRDLAQAVLEGLRADAFETSADPAALAGWEAAIAECDAELAELRNA